MRGRVIGATPSHTQAARTVHNTTPQQQFPPQPRPQSDGVVNRPANEVSTPSNEPKVILHLQQTVSGNAAEPDENPRSEQSRPAYPGPTSTVSATKASTSTTSANDQSHFSQHHNGHSQRSGQPQPASPRPASTVSATEASTSTTSANDPSHFSQHHNGQSQRSAQLQPAPEQLEQTASSVTHVSTLENASITCIIRRKRWDRANHEQQHSLEQNEKVRVPKHYQSQQKQ